MVQESIKIKHIEMKKNAQRRRKHCELAV